MAIYLNTKAPFENYSELAREYYFVDKSEIIKSLNSKVSTKSKYVCITRPRRFGKSSVADMLGAYYSKAVDSLDEYTFLKDRIYDEYFGFTNEEVLELCEKNNEIKFSELESWYNGYLTTKGKKYIIHVQ